MADPNFRDVEKQLSRNQGVLAGDAWSDQERIDNQVNSERLGWDFTCRCQTCGRPVKITVVWGELIVASCGLVPQDADSGQPWVFHQGFLYPPITCGCGKEIHVPMTPDMASRFIATGVQMQILNPQQVAHEQQVARSRGQQRR
jgi:hypothetical protein